MMKYVAPLMAAIMSLAGCVELRAQNAVVNNQTVRFRVQTGTSAPSSGACDASSEVGSVYARTGDQASVPTQLYLCKKTGSSSYAWGPVFGYTQTSAPATCAVGELWFDTDATAGSNLNLCTSANTWTAITGGPGGGSFDCTTDVDAGDGIGIDTSTCTFSVDTTVVRTTGDQTITGVKDFSGAAHTFPEQVGTTLPATCTVGERFFKSDATAGSNSYGCTATDTWTAQGGSGSAPFSDFVLGSSVAMTMGLDVTLASTSAPALAAGKCYSIAVNISNQSALDVQYYIKVGSTIIETPFGSTNQVLLLWSFSYCNNPGSQTVQTLVHDGPLRYGSTDLTSFIGTSTAPIATPTGVDWSTGQTISLTGDASTSGNITTATLRVSLL